MVTRAKAAILTLSQEFDPKDPFASSLLRALADFGHEVGERRLIEHWKTRSVGHPAGDMRYRWELSHKHAPAMPSYAPLESWRAWRSTEGPVLERDPFEFEERLALPIVLTDTVELLSKRSAYDEDAAQLLAEAGPALRRDFASYVQAIHPWRDTFALWCLTHHPLALGQLHPLAVASATCHAADVEPGMSAVHGKRFPFHQKPLVSASAQLAMGLFTLGLELEMVGRLATHVADSRRATGGWGDVVDESDVLTTLVAADLLSNVDPSFDAGLACEYFVSQQGNDGLFRALGPEAPWLTHAVIRWVESAHNPFADRFRWPFVVDANRGHKTQLPFYAYFVDVAELFERMPGLARTSTEMAFIDLAGFRVFNNRYGQDRGDDVLRAFADALVELRGSAVIRDGGDEFVIIGAPCRRGLQDDMESFRMSWPGRFAATFGDDVPTVAPRILVTACTCGTIVKTRERLGREIGLLKERAGIIGPEGVVGVM